MTPERLQRVETVLAQRQPDLTVLAEKLHKPRNFAAVMRTCDAVGIGTVHAVPGEDGLARYPHTAQGADKWVAVAQHGDVVEAIAALKARGMQCVAAHLSPQAVDFRRVDYTRPTALVLGTELFGVSDAAVALVDREIVIPMLGFSQSLNVSVACAVVLYEAQRQRQAAGLYDRRRIDDATYQRLRFEWLHPAVARWCRRHGQAYPAIGEDGELAEPLQGHSGRG